MSTFRPFGSSIRRLLHVVAAAVCVALFPANFACADNSAVLVLPQPPPPPAKIPPWRIQIDPSGIEGQAYHAVKITVATDPRSGPVAENHTLKVVLSPNGHVSTSYDEKVTAFIEVPEGSSSIDAIVDVPQRQQWNVIHVQFFEDGLPIKNCEASFNQNRTNFRNWGDDTTGVLVIDSDAPTRDEFRALMATITSPPKELKGRQKLTDVRWLLAAIPSNQVAGNLNLVYNVDPYDDAQLLQTYAAHEGMDLVSPSELSPRWLSQSNADLVVISLDDLKLLAQQYPDRHEALQRWTMAGGSLVVFDCGEDWQRFPELCRLAGLPADEKQPEESDVWRMAQKSKFHDNVEGLFNQNTGYAVYQQPNGTVVSSGPQQPTAQVKWTKSPFAWRRCGLGAVVAYRSDNPFPGVPSDWGGLWNTLGSQQFLWSRRHGMSHHRENSDFWNFVIPGVGEAPVFSFMTMIALFMLLIGPMNYYYLNRWRRLSLLLVTVPVGAGIFTLGLFAFALLSDGFSTRSRVRSYTVLEPASGLAATISRQTYYTAFVPSDGMRYPPDTAVYPLHYSPPNEAVSGYYYYQSDSQWVDGQLQLQRRYLTAREHRQFMTVRSTKSAAKLDVRSAGDALQVKNLLGTQIEYGLLVDDEGRLHVVDGLAADAVAAVPLIEPAAAQLAWRKRLEPKAPMMPGNYDPNRYNTMFSRGRYNYNYWGRNSSQWDPTQSSGELERGILEVDALLGRMRDAANAAAGNERTFVAITSDSVQAEDGEPLAPLGVRGSRVVESLHVVRGRW